MEKKLECGWRSMGINPDLQDQINELICEYQIRSASLEKKKHRKRSRNWWKTIE